MYTVMIAEDEQLERDTLEDILRSSKLPITAIFKAKDGEEAVQVYESQQPDILLLDIEMPKRSGLDALQCIRAMEKKRSTCLILTSFDYFAYAQRAIHLGVDDFILKPASPSHIINSVQKLINQMQMKKNENIQIKALLDHYHHVQPLLEEDCANAIFLHQGEMQIQRAFQNLNIHMNEGVCSLLHHTDAYEQVLAHVKQNLEELAYRCILYQSDLYGILFIISNHPFLADDMEVIRNQFYNKGIAEGQVCFGMIAQSYEQLYTSYKQAKTEYFEVQKQNAKQQQLPISIEWSLKLFQVYEGHLDKDVLEEFFLTLSRMEEEKQTPIYIESVIQFLKLCNKGYTLQMHTDDFIPVSLSGIDSTTKRKMKVIDQLNVVFDMVDEVRFKGMHHLAIKSLDYIKKNYSKPFTLNDLALELRITPTYLSHLLSQNFHRNYTDIVNDYRIKAAKKLIREHLLLKDIAYQVGFSSPSYFARIFKKNVGLSPTEYSSLFK